MELHSARHILLCLRYGIGDVVMETPAIEALRQATQACITALGASPAIQILENDPRVDELFSIQDFGLGHWADWGNEQTRGQFQTWLDQKRFDLVVDPSHAVFGLREIIWEQGGPILDTGSDDQNCLLRLGAFGETALRWSVLKGWGLSIGPDVSPRIIPTEGEHERADAFLRAAGCDKEFIAVSPVASSVLKQWPLDRVAEVVDTLVEATGCSILLITGPERDGVGKLLQMIGTRSTIAVADGLHLKMVAAILTRAKLLLSNDTGIMHMASAVGTPLVAVFGPTSSRIYLPTAWNATAVESEGNTCPYRNKDVFGPSCCIMAGNCFRGGKPCIEEVDVRAVLKACTRALLPEHRKIPQRVITT
ncbi:MAG: glycosyltransferase family 9 protein [Desulfovibrionales bacterium]